jgi:hypothetical protein
MSDADVDDDMILPPGYRGMIQDPEVLVRVHSCHIRL